MSGVQTTDIIAKNIGLPTFFKHSGLVDKKKKGTGLEKLIGSYMKKHRKPGKNGVRPINFCPLMVKVLKTLSLE